MFSKCIYGWMNKFELKCIESKCKYLNKGEFIMARHGRLKSLQTTLTSEHSKVKDKIAKNKWKCLWRWSWSQHIDYTQGKRKAENQRESQLY